MVQKPGSIRVENFDPLNKIKNKKYIITLARFVSERETI